MMLQNPWALAGVPIVAIVAAIRLLRPQRRRVPVGSLTLWRNLLAEEGDLGRQRRRVSLSWLLLLLGALSAILAAAGPVMMMSDSGAVSRVLPGDPSSVVLEAVSAEVLDDSASQLFLALGNRSNGDLTVEVSLSIPAPCSAGGSDAPGSDGLASVSIRQQDAPGSLNTPHTSITEPPALQGARGADVAGNRTYPASFTIQAKSRASRVWELPSDVRSVGVCVDGERLADLTRIDRPCWRVGLVGRENPFVRRFLAAMEGVEVTADPAGADLVIASGVDLPAGMPGIALGVPTSPPGFRQAEKAVGPVHLARADRLLDSPLLAEVNFAGVIVRQVRPWVSEGYADGDRLVSCEGRPIMVATDRPRRLHVAFEPTGDVTNWPLDESFPIMMAAALEWIAPERGRPVWQASIADRSQTPQARDEIVPARPVEAWSWFALVAAGLWFAAWLGQSSR